MMRVYYYKISIQCVSFVYKIVTRNISGGRALIDVESGRSQVPKYTFDIYFQN